jgi:hypothetical protein
MNSQSFTSQGDQYMPKRSVSSLCRLRQVSSALSRNCRNEVPDVGEARGLWE